VGALRGALGFGDPVGWYPNGLGSANGQVTRDAWRAACVAGGDEKKNCGGGVVLSGLPEPIEEPFEFVSRDEPGVDDQQWLLRGK
jgi:hypothetical protein